MTCPSSASETAGDPSAFLFGTSEARTRNASSVRWAPPFAAAAAASSLFFFFSAVSLRGGAPTDPKIRSYSPNSARYALSRFLVILH